MAVSNLAFWAPDEDGLLFSLVSSFMAWQKTVGGCLKSNLRFSNTFLVPELLDNQREGYRSLGLSLLGSEQPLVGSVYEALCGLLGDVAPGALFENHQRLKG